MKIILNKCFGGFGLSDEAYELMGLELDSYYNPDDVRKDPRLIACIEALGLERYSGFCAELQVVEIPDNFTDYEIDDYDGWERLTYVIDGKIYHA